METTVFKTDAEFVAQLNTASAKVDAHSADLNMDVADVDSLKADAKYCQWALTVSDIIDTYSQAVNKYKDILFGKIKDQPLGTFPPLPVLPPAPTAVAADARKRMTDMVQDWKREELFNDSVAEDLGVLAPVNPSDPDTAKPKVTGILAMPDRVKAFFKKEGWFAVRGYLSYDGTNWVKGDIDPTSPFEDFRKNQTANTPETRHLKFRFVNTKGEEVGLESDVVKVVTEIY
jgi:hypothetical protein